MVRPERELAEVTVEVLRANMNMRAVHRVLEQLPKRLDPVRRKLDPADVIGPGPFLAAMVDGAVSVSVAFQ